MTKPKLKIGTIVELTQTCLEWKAKHAEEVHNLARCIIDKLEPEKRETLESYLLDALTHKAGLRLHGVIAGDNGYDDDDFAYLIWEVNELGENVEWLQPEDFEVIG